MRAAVRYCVAMGILMLLMFLKPSILSGVTGGLLMHVLGLSVTLCIVGVLGAIYFMWAPSRDELVRRKSEPYYEGIHVRRITLVDHFFSVSASGQHRPLSRPSLNLRRSARQRCQGDPVAQRFAMVKRMTKHPATQSGGIPKSIQIEELSALIHKSENTIRTCATNKKYQHLIPRPFKMPHSRRLCWWLDDVLA